MPFIGLWGLQMLSLCVAFNHFTTQSLPESLYLTLMGE